MLPTLNIIQTFSDHTAFIKPQFLLIVELTITKIEIPRQVSIKYRKANAFEVEASPL